MTTVRGSLKVLVEEIIKEIISEEVPSLFSDNPLLGPVEQQRVSPLVGALRQTKKKLRDSGDQPPEMILAQEKQIDTLIAKLLTKRKGRANLSRGDMEALDRWTRWMTVLPFGRAYRRGLAKYLRSKKDGPHKEDPFRDFRRYTYDDPMGGHVPFREAAMETTEEDKEDKTGEKYYHGTNLGDLKPGALVLPPNKTKRVSEKDRKKNLDVVFFTKDPRSALIYAGRAVQSFGGGIATVYQVEPQGPVSTINDTPGTTVFSAPYARVVGKIKFTKKPKGS
jgi:hypothetical protein